MTGPFNSNPNQPDNQINNPIDRGYSPPPQQQTQNVDGSTFVPPKKKAKWPWIVGGIFLFLLILGGGCSFAVYKLISSPVGVTNQYYAALSEGDYNRAQEFLCDELSSVSANDLESVYPNISEPEFFSVSKFSENKEIVSGTLRADGLEQVVVTQVEKEDGDWKVCIPLAFFVR